MYGSCGCCLVHLLCLVDQIPTTKKYLRVCPPITGRRPTLATLLENSCRGLTLRGKVHGQTLGSAPSTVRRLLQVAVWSKGWVTS